MKYKYNGDVDRYKAWLASKCTVNEKDLIIMTLSSIVEMVTIRIVLSRTASHG